MAWTLFLARAGARTAKRTAAEMIDGDGVVDRLFQLAVIVTIWVVAPVLIVVACTRALLVHLLGHPVSTVTVLQTLAVTLVVGTLLVVAIRARRSSRRSARAASARAAVVSRPAPPARPSPAPSPARAWDPVRARPAERPLTGPQLGALHQIREASGPVAVDTVARYQSSEAVRALVAHGLLAVDPQSGRFVLR